MNQTKELTQCSRPKDTTISLPSGETVDVWVNRDIFTPHGNLKKKEFTDIEDTHLLSFQWPVEIRLTTVTHWTAEITTGSSERRCEFAQRSALELGHNQWEMAKGVLEGCYKKFDAYLLEVSLWGVRLGHKDSRSAQQAVHNKDSVLSDLTCLLADTDYLFRDITLHWKVGFLPCSSVAHVGVQETSSVASHELSCVSSIAVDHPASQLSSFLSGSSLDHHPVDVTSVDPKEVLVQVLKEVHEIRRSLIILDRRVEENHLELCHRLDAGQDGDRSHGLLSLPHTLSDQPAPTVMLPSVDHETPQRPEQESRGREPTPLTYHTTKQHGSPDSHRVSQSGHHHTGISAPGSTNHPSQRQVPTQASKSQHQAKNESTSDSDSSTDSRNLASPTSWETSRNRPTGALTQRERTSRMPEQESPEASNDKGRKRPIGSSKHSREHFPVNQGPQGQQVPRQRGSTQDVPRQRGSTQESAVVLQLIAGDPNFSSRNRDVASIKENQDNPKKATNLTSARPARDNGQPSPSATDFSTRHSEVNQPEISSSVTTTSNSPSASVPPPTAGISTNRHRNRDEPHHGAGRRDEYNHSTRRRGEPHHGAGRRDEHEHGAGRGYEREHGARRGYEHEHGAGRRDEHEHGAGRGYEHGARKGYEHEHGARGSTEGYQKESFTPQGLGGPSNGSHHSKSGHSGRMKLLVDSHTEARLVRESVERAYREDEVKSPKARSFDTMLCLDISGSMKEGGAFEQMKRTVSQFIEGVEDIVTQTGTEENMGLVTFGGRANVVQNLTNDFSLIRDQIDLMEPGGKSPYVEALLVAMAAFVGKGGIVSVSGEWLVKPRIIYISDGLPTESAEEHDDCDLPSNPGHVRVSLINVLQSFKKGDRFNKVHPIFFIPVGTKADKKYMQTMADLCDGVYMEPENVQELCQYFRVQDTIGKVLACLKGKSEEMGPQVVDATITALTPDLTSIEKKKVSEVVHQELKNPTRKRQRSEDVQPDDLDNVFEDTDKVNQGKRLPLGTRVIRGPDWKFNDQDGEGPGTVIHHDYTCSVHWVNWDRGGSNCYGFSNNRGYDIWRTDEHPRLRKGNEPLAIGMTVKKGASWRPDESLSEQGTGLGVIIRKSNSKLMVRWSNGVLQMCVWTQSGNQEVDYCPPDEDPDTQHQLPPSRSDWQNQCEPVTITFEGRGQWQWCDDNNTWHSYDPNINQQIEATCKKKSPKTCVFEKDGELHRIMFRKMMAKVVDKGKECKVQRLVISS
ncbi:uncharacterized protein LOC143298527 [Babylonia areolata]|uniref:uncharacterized protein LOC143298527 n=1 Tax=Babylonia areolata TaxID=304850 RepID=UPI003FCF2C53